VINYLRKYWSQDAHWPQQLPYVAWMHNCNQDARSGLTPFNLIYGREAPSFTQDHDVGAQPRMSYADNLIGEIHNRILALERHASENRQVAKRMEKAKYDRNESNAGEIPLGALVYVTAMSQANRPKKLQEKFQGPYEVIGQSGVRNYSLRRISDGRSYVVHRNRIKWRQGQFAGQNRQEKPRQVGTEKGGRRRRARRKGCPPGREMHFVPDDEEYGEVASEAGDVNNDSFHSVESNNDPDLMQSDQEEEAGQNGASGAANLATNGGVVVADESPQPDVTTSSAASMAGTTAHARVRNPRWPSHATPMRTRARARKEAGAL